MTLVEIWKKHRTNLCLVAARPTGVYIPLALKNWEEAEPAEEDAYSMDWFVAEVIPHDCDAIPHERCSQHGQASSFEAR